MLSGCLEENKKFIIPEGHVGMFGYGSLMSKKFIETGLLHNGYDVPYLSAHLKGYKRSWSFAWPSSLPGFPVDNQYFRDYILVEGDTIYPQNLVYLNISESPETVLNGVLYIVLKADLPVYDEWELGYERFEVTDRIIDYEITGGPVYAYKALPEFIRKPDSNLSNNIIEKGYYDIIEDAFAYWGTDFEEEYLKNTEPFDTLIIQQNKKKVWVNPPLDKLEELRSVFKSH